MTSNLKNVHPNWQKVRFDEIVEIATDRVEDPVESGLEYFIGLEHLDTDCIRIKRFGSSKDVCSSKFICKKGDIIFGRRRSYLRKVAITDRDAVVSTDSMVFRPSGDKIYPDFLPCFMQSSIFWKAVHANSEGSMSPRIKWKALAAQEFWLPSIEEQKKISELLWSIEDNIQKTEKLIETTETLKQGLLNELLTKGIGHTRFKDSELGRIPEEWEVKKIKDFCDVKGGKRLPKGASFETEITDHPYLRVTDFKNGSIDISNIKYINDDDYETIKQYVINTNDIYISIAGTIGIVGEIPEQLDGANLTENAAKIVIHDKNCLDEKYLKLYLMSPLGQHLIQLNTVKTTQPKLALSKIKEIKIPLPKIREQRNIVLFFSSSEAQVFNFESNLKNLLNLKRKLIDELISGSHKTKI